MRKHGVEVTRPVEPVSIQISQVEKDSTDPDVYPVRVILKHVDPTSKDHTEAEIVHAKYVIGGDGEDMS
ncbi:hypothetical protein H0H93_006493 [Arthromyces matolae]|nr:hypothetical protein H0H93_006493 [Arthromyces matolae]